MTKSKPEIITLLIFGIILVLLGTFIIFNAPMHYAPFEITDSYEDLFAAFRDSDTVFLPEDDGTVFESGEVFLVGRTLLAKPERYEMHRMERIDDTAVYYDVGCDWSSSSRITGEQTYRGVRYQLTANTDKDAYSHVSVHLILGQMSYGLSAHYLCDTLEEAQMQNINEKAADRLELYTKQIIDQYLQRADNSHAKTSWELTVFMEEPPRICRIDEADAAVLDEILDVGNMEPGGPVESPCVYQFRAGGDVFSFDDSLTYVDAHVNQKYYGRYLSEEETAVLKALVAGYAD